jgi:L-lactate dehydrogenase complex protein LldE
VRVSIFATCLVDQFRPEVGLAMVRVLDRLGIAHQLPPAQTCCGQPAFNSGFSDEARIVARQFLRAFADAEHIVAPSGSCTAMARNYIPGLFTAGSPEHQHAIEIASRVRELSDFLVNVAHTVDVGARFPHRVTLQPSCHLLRELGVDDAPRTLLSAVKDIDIIPLPSAETCCGFGGTFAVKYSAISAAMGRDKVVNIASTGAEFVVSNDSGCLMHIGGLLHRNGSAVRAVHLAEVIGSGDGDRGSRF